MKIAIGTRFYRAGPDSDQRQEGAREALRTLTNVHPINLQFVDESFSPPGLRTLPVLEQDSRTVTGGDGLRKPIATEVFDVLAGVARAEGCRYFVYLNSDIEVTDAALDRIRGGGLDGQAFCRMDVDPGTRADPRVQTFGIDMFAIEADWWRRERHRFRPYIAGDAWWDNVYAALVCAHGRGDIVDRSPGIFHQRHQSTWNVDSIFNIYNGYLAALDAPYFSQWVTFTSRRAADEGGDRRALIEEIFDGGPLPPLESAIHAARRLRAAWRYRRRRRQVLKAAAAGPQ